MSNEPQAAQSSGLSLCEAMGVESGAFSQFIDKRDEALRARQAKYEERVREALQEELAWAE